MLNSSITPESRSTPQGSPYPGLRAFDEKDVETFFGREEEVTKVAALLEAQQLVVVHGVSGCGKSSLVRAGVVPVFRIDTIANDLEARVIAVKPTDLGGPLWSLAERLDAEFPRSRSGANIDADINPANSWHGLLSSSPNWAVDISKAARDVGATLCLILDQFEEVFPMIRGGHAAEIRRVVEFLNSLVEAAPEGSALGQRSLSVIVTMRSDYLGQCALFDGFAETVNRCQFLLPKLSYVGLLRAIHEPARLNGGIVEEAAANQLLPVLARETDGLPILQHALMRAWHHRVVNPSKWSIGLEQLNAVGGADAALSKHADEAFLLATEGSDQFEAVANNTFRSLSDIDSDGKIIRRTVSLSQLVSECGVAESIIRHIVDVFRGPSFSLVMPYADVPLLPSTMISVSHEALLRQWRKIVESDFDMSGRPIGLVYRELQDGMIWRSLVIQAQQYKQDRSSILGAAATEQRLPWYWELEGRFGWTARYPLRGSWLTAEELADVWRQVSNLMEASERNLAREREKLAVEQQMVKSLKFSRVMIVVLAVGFSILAIGLVMLTYIRKAEQERSMVEQERTAFLTARLADAEKLNDIGSRLYELQMQTAKEMAGRVCAGKRTSEANREACLRDNVSAYLGELQSEKEEPGRQPNSGFGQPTQNGREQ